LGFLLRNRFKNIGKQQKKFQAKNGSEYLIFHPIKRG
jgi:hypothetical protein